MSREAPGAAATNGGRTAIAGLFVLLTVVALVMIVRARPGPEPFDPRSSSPSGTRALVLLLERIGADVDVVRTPPDPGASARLLVLADTLDDEQRAATLDFVEAGGVAVVADAESSLHGGSGPSGGAVTVTGRQLPRERGLPLQEANLERGRCTVAALSPLRGLYVPDGLLFPVGPDEPQCFGRDGTSFVVVREVGAGTVVGLGDNELLTNAHLRRADNAGLAAALLSPDGGPVAVLIGSDVAAGPVDVGSGEDTLFDIVPQWVWMGLVLGGLAFVVFAVARGVRVGRIPEEPLVSPIAGSELVEAQGALMRRAQHQRRAAWLLQMQLHRDLCEEFHVEPTAPVADLDRTVSQRTGTPPGAVESTLRTEVADDHALLALATRIDHLRRDIAA